MTGGSVSRSAGVLSRASELSRLSEKLAGMQEKLIAANTAAEEAKRELDKAQYELEVAQSQQRKAEDEVLQYQGKQDHYDILNETLRQSCGDMEADLASFGAQNKVDEAKCAEVAKAITASEALAAEKHSAADAVMTDQSEALEKSNTLSQQVADIKAQQAALAAERDSTMRTVENLTALQADMAGDKTDKEALIARFEQANVEAQTQINAHQASLDALRSQTEGYRQKLAELSNAKLALEGQRDAMNRESRSRNDTLIAATQELERISQKLESSALEESAILDKLWERYELSHSDAMAQRMELESVPKATRRIAELNREIKSLGTPNIGAIEEYERVNSRYTYLSDQRSDVEKAKEELSGIIDEITKQMTEIFATQFRLLNESFQETFLELFGGGKAQLELEDENDILGCGIEIKVQPPGKQLKTITLLSGGEKAFVAIALYFAILKVHPTPFCVMDEIEAALDEANVVRYARYMRRIAGKTQFIVITHRRGTMEEADVLYGVTMQERGISRVLTINMNDLANDLRIKK